MFKFNDLLIREECDSCPRFDSILGCELGFCVYNSKISLSDEDYELDFSFDD